MSLLHVLDKVFIRLSTIPGLGFLYDYVHEIEVQKQRRQEIVSTYRGYVQSVRSAGAEATTAVRGQGDDDEHGDPGGGRVQRGGKAAQAEVGRRGKEDDFDDELDEDDEDDDFESYLQ